MYGPEGRWKELRERAEAAEAERDRLREENEELRRSLSRADGKCDTLDAAFVSERTRAKSAERALAEAKEALERIASKTGKCASNGTKWRARLARETLDRLSFPTPGDET